MRSTVPSRSFTPWLFGMSKRQYRALALALLGSGVAAAAIDLTSQLRLGGLGTVSVTVSVNTGVFVLAAFAVGAALGALVSLPVVLVFHYATPRTRGMVRLVVILVSGFTVAGWLFWVFIPALEHAF